MNELEKLKNRFLSNKRTPKEKDQFARLCQIMTLCGGYEKFLETPIPTLRELSNYCDYMEEKENERLQAMFGKKK